MKNIVGDSTPLHISYELYLTDFEKSIGKSEIIPLLFVILP